METLRQQENFILDGSMKKIAIHKKPLLVLFSKIYSEFNFHKHCKQHNSVAHFLDTQ